MAGRRVAAVAAWTFVAALGVARLTAAPPAAPDPGPALAPAPAIPQQGQDRTAGCRARIDIIRWDLRAVYTAGGIGGDDPLKTYTNLDDKLTTARTALEENRQLPALDRLKEFEGMVILLRDEIPARLSATAAQVLLFGDSDRPIDEGVNGAIICVWLMN